MFSSKIVGNSLVKEECIMNEQQLVDQGYRKYSGEKIDVFFNANVCTHSAHCVTSNNEVFNLKNKPWINADAASADEVAKIVSGCPSGALQYIMR